MDDAQMWIIALQIIVMVLLIALLTAIIVLSRRIAPALAAASKFLGGGDGGSPFGDKQPKPMDMVMYTAAQVLPGIIPEIRMAVKQIVGGIVQSINPGAAPQGGPPTIRAEYIPIPVSGVPNPAPLTPALPAPAPVAASVPVPPVVVAKPAIPPLTLEA